MLIYSTFAKSTLQFFSTEIKFEIIFFGTVIFSQKISREKITYIAGSFDSVKRNEIVLLTENGFKLLYKPKNLETGGLNDKMLKSNILIIDTRPMLSAQRYFLYGKLHQLLK
jgi:hypothetical protein